MLKDTINEEGKWETLSSEYLHKRPWLTVRKDCVRIPNGEIMTVSGNTSATSNISHCFLARGVRKVSGQELDRTEDIQVHLLSKEDVFSLLEGNEIRQSLMAAPLWRYFAEHPLK